MHTVNNKASLSPKRGIVKVKTKMKVMWLKVQSKVKVVNQDTIISLLNLIMTHWRHNDRIEMD